MKRRERVARNKQEGERNGRMIQKIVDAKQGEKTEKVQKVTEKGKAN